MSLPNSIDIVTSYFNQINEIRKPSTSKMYEWHMMKYFKYLKSINKSLHQSDSDDILSYLKTKSTWNTVAKNHFLAIVKGFYRYYSNKISAGQSDSDLRFKLNRESVVHEILYIPYYRKRESLIRYDINKLSDYGILLKDKYNREFCSI